MKYTVKLLTITFVMLLLLMMPEKSNSSFDRTPFFDVIEKLEPYPTGGGAINLQVVVTPKFKCEEIILEIVDTYNLTYSGPMIMTEPGQESLATIFEIPVIIPENDTSGIAFIINKETKERDGGRIYWVVDEDTVKTFDSDPRQFISTLLRNKKKKIITAEERRMAEGGPIDPMGKDTTYYTDGKGNVISKEKYNSRKSKSKKFYAPDEGLPDTAYVWKKGEDGYLYQVKKSELPTREEQKLQRQLENKRKLEETPLTKFDQQDIMVGDTVYTRARGEYKFHKAVFTNDPSGYYGRRIDSLRTLEDKRIYELTLDLREPQEFEYVKDLVDSLIPMEEEGFYRTVTTGAVMQQLRANRIKVGIYPEKPYLQESSRSKHKKSINKSSSDSSEKE